MTPAQLFRLQTAADLVEAGLRAGADAEAVIQALIAAGGARRCAPQTNTLRAGGITVSCSWSTGKGLLNAWRRRATIRIMVARAA